MLAKHQIFVNKYLPVQTQRHEINICIKKDTIRMSLT